MSQLIKVLLNVLKFLGRFYGIGIPRSIFRAIANGRGSIFINNLVTEAMRYADVSALEVILRPMGKRTLFPAWWYLRGKGKGADVASKWKENGTSLEFNYSVDSEILEKLQLSEQNILRYKDKIRRCKARFVIKPPQRFDDDPIVIYLHGGNFGFGLTALDGILMSEVLAPITAFYPYATLIYLEYQCVGNGPKGEFPGALLDLVELYKHLRAMYGEAFQRVWIVSNNSGSALNLGLLQYLATCESDPETYIPYPEKSYMISPWLNITTTQPPEDPKDEQATITYNFMNAMAAAYCNSLGTEDARNNPFVNIELNMDKVLWSDRILKRTAFRFAMSEEEPLLRDQIVSFTSKLDIPLREVPLSSTIHPSSILYYGHFDKGGWSLDEPVGHDLKTFFLFE